MRPGGLLLDPNVAAFALNVCLIISFFNYGKETFFSSFINIFIRLLILFGVLLTVSRSGYIASIIILLFMLIKFSYGPRRWVPGITALLFVLFFFIFNKSLEKTWGTLYQIIDLKRIFPSPLFMEQNHNIPYNPPPETSNGFFGQERMVLIKTSLKIFTWHPLVGVGIGNVANNIESLTGSYLETHNMMLQLLTESGAIILIAIILFAINVYSLIKEMKGDNRHLLILIIIIVGTESLFNHNLLNLNLIWILIAFIFGMNMIENASKRDFTITW